MEEDLQKTLKFLDATNATNLVTSKQIVPQIGSSSIQEENEEEKSEVEEDFSLFVKKFLKFVKKRRIERFYSIMIIMTNYGWMLND